MLVRVHAISLRVRALCTKAPAHTNVPGSRHEKRYQDVEELLDAGISVIGTRARIDTTRREEEAKPEVHGIADAERVMVCMASQPRATRRMLRRGARLAGGLDSVWFVVYVRTPNESPARIDTAALRSLSDNITLARELGAEVVRLEGEDVPDALARFARERRITHAVFGRTRLPLWRERLRGSVVDRFMRLVPEIDVVVVGVAPRAGAAVSRRLGAAMRACTKARGAPGILHDATASQPRFSPPARRHG